MDNEIHQVHSGIGDNIGRDKIINNIYVNTKDFQELESRLKELQADKQELNELITKYPDEGKFKTKLLKVDANIAEQEQKMESFKADVSRLYETFTKIEINTERLRLAKAYFDKGEFREADAILKAEEISNEVSQLKQAKIKKEDELSAINKHLESKANEFLVKAQLWKTFYAEPDWFEKTCEYYEAALDASRTDEIIFQYALFLQDHNQFSEAQSLYEEALQIYRELANENPRTYLPDVAMTLNNLAILQKAKNEFAAALGNYEEALQIYRELANENPRTYLPYVATTLNNLAVLQSDKNEFAVALGNYEEALRIRRELANKNPRTYLPYVAGTLNNLAVLHSDKNEFAAALGNYEEALQIYRKLANGNPATYLPYVAGTLNNLANLHSDKNELAAFGNYKEALQIYRELAKENPRTYLPNVATTLNNLALLQKDKNEYAAALGNYEEALQIYRELAKENPRIYLPDVAMTVINLSIFYLQAIPDKEKSIALAMEAVELLLPVYEQVPYLENYLKTAVQVLQANGVDMDEMMNNE